MFSLLAVVLLSCFTRSLALNSAFRFANMYGDSMVLQQHPFSAQLWGFSSINQEIITITLTNTNKKQLIETLSTKSFLINNNSFIWNVSFSPIHTNFDSYNITAKDSLSNTIALSNILFGDVFVCSGQSNMVFSIEGAMNASQEIQKANNCPFIRLFTSTQLGAPSEQLEFISVEQKWSIASNMTVNGGDVWTYFSALCWFWGVEIYNYLNYPVGLITSAVSGSPIRSFLPSDSISVCNESDQSLRSEPNDSTLYNAMIYPLLRTTIKGLIWYQGEFFYFFK